MKQIFAALLALLIALPSIGAEFTKKDVEHQLGRLESELGRRGLYIQKRQAIIDTLRSEVASVPTDSIDGRWLDKIRLLGDQYSLFNIDSALVYYTLGYNHAQRLGLDTEAAFFNLNRAKVYPVVGFSNRAVNIFNDIDTVAFTPAQMAEYHDTGRQMYSYISSFYTKYPDEYRNYSALSGRHQEQLLPLLPQNSLRYTLNLGEHYFSKGEYAKARALISEALDSLPDTDNRFARAAHILSDIALARGNDNEYLYYLTLSAIADTRSATLEVNSLQQLGRALYERGDIKRAHTFLLLALEDAVQGHATMRLVQTAEYMPLIESAHRAEIERERSHIFVALAMLAVLVVVLAITLWFIRLEMRQMSILQGRMERASQIKDVYISQFLSLCSIYMDKLNQFCKIANRKITAGQVDDLYKMTKSGKFVEEQSREFYEVFDNAFLNLYPNFVASVNHLLRPEERIVLAEGEKLNTDLRILAFMRLGIEDAGKIAQVLNYSVNTIYTYRNKLRNRAINRETFEVDVMRIPSYL